MGKESRRRKLRRDLDTGDEVLTTAEELKEDMKWRKVAKELNLMLPDPTRRIIRPQFQY